MLKALIVDAEIDRWFMLNAVLRQNRIKTNFVNSLAAAREAIKKEAPSMLFFHNYLQEGFGFNFIQYIRTNYPRIKIVMVKDEEGATARGKAPAGIADLLISKPFNTEIIGEAIRKIL